MARRAVAGYAFLLVLATAAGAVALTLDAHPQAWECRFDRAQGTYSTQVRGDFDGDGRANRLRLTYPRRGAWRVDVRFANGTTGALTHSSRTACDRSPAVRNLDTDRADEALVAAGGASAHLAAVLDAAGNTLSWMQGPDGPFEVVEYGTTWSPAGTAGAYLECHDDGPSGEVLAQVDFDGERWERTTYRIAEGVATVVRTESGVQDPLAGRDRDRVCRRP